VWAIPGQVQPEQAFDGLLGLNAACRNSFKCLLRLPGHAPSFVISRENRSYLEQE
jgi:hypothetical protein